MPKNFKKAIVAKNKKAKAIAIKPIKAIKKTSDTYLARRPHRSFRRTRRRDYQRSLKLPGYFAFTRMVNKSLLSHKKTFIGLAVLYAILTAILVGIGSQDTYATLTSTLQQTGSDIFKGNLGQIGQAALLFVSIGSTGLSGTPTEAQQIFIIVIGLLVWLTTVWLHRNFNAGHAVRLRDGLYNAGAPIISTLVIAIVFALQLIPLALAIIGYAAASTSGLLAGGVAAMLFWFAAALLAMVSLYWITSTFFALIVVTLPGMYPGQALKTAGDMMVGRRLRVLLRILWMLVCMFIIAAIVLIPFILIDTILSNVWPAVSTIPIIPVVLMLVSVVVFIWAASYIYLLYRKVIDDDAKPA